MSKWEKLIEDVRLACENEKMICIGVKIAGLIETCFYFYINELVINENSFYIQAGNYEATIYNNEEIHTLDEGYHIVKDNNEMDLLFVA